MGNYNKRLFTNSVSFEDLVVSNTFSDLSEEMTTINKFGINLDVDAGLKEDIWSAGGTKAEPDNTDILEVFSTDVNDTAAGTGTRTLRIFGYDIDCNFIQEDITMNGTTIVESTLEFKDIYRVITLTSGSNEYNVGTLCIRQKTGSIVLGEIAIGYNITQMSHFIIPNGYRGIFLAGTANISGIQGASGVKIGDVSLEIKSPGMPWLRTITLGLTSNAGMASFDFPLKPVYPAKTKIKATCETETNDTKVSITYSIILVKEANFD